MFKTEIVTARKTVIAAIMLSMFSAGMAPCAYAALGIEGKFKMDATQPGQDSDESESHPDFAWKRAGIDEVPLSGSRIGILDANGTLRVTLATDTAGGSFVLAHNVKRFQLMNDSIALLKQNGNLLMAYGSLATPLKLVSKNVAAFQLTETRMGILLADGTLLLKEYGFEPSKIATDVKSFHVTPDRLGVLFNDGKLWMHEGGAITQMEQFVKIADNVSRFQLDRDWVAYSETNQGKLLVGKGPLRDKQGKPPVFIEHGTNIDDFEIEVTVDLGDVIKSRAHLAVVGRGGKVSVGESNQDQATILLRDAGVSNAKSVRWAGRQLAIHTTGGEVRLAKLKPENGEFEAPIASIGVVSDFGINPEGMVVTHRGKGKLGLIEAQHRADAKMALADKTGGLKAATKAEGSNLDPQEIVKPVAMRKNQALNTSNETALAEPGGTVFDVSAVGMSSLRPMHVRRSVDIRDQ